MTTEARGENPQPKIIDAEKTPEKEMRIPVKTVFVSGPSYSGKGILTRGEQALNGWGVYNGKDDFIKFNRREGEESTRIRNNLAAQRIFDRNQLERILRLTPQDAILYETRLAGINFAEARDIRAEEYLSNQRERQTNPNLPTVEMIPGVSLLLTASLEVRVERAYELELANWEARIKFLKRGQEPPVKPTKTAIEALLIVNQERDIDGWSKLRQHQNYVRKGENPFIPNLTRPNGGLVYDWKIDTSDLTPQELIEKFEMEADAWGIYLPKGSPRVENPTTVLIKGNADVIGPEGIILDYTAQETYDGARSNFSGEPMSTRPKSL